MLSFNKLILVASLVLAIVSSSIVSADELHLVKGNNNVDLWPTPPTNGTISAIYKCQNASCTTGCVQAPVIIQGACTHVEVAHSYIKYTCINNGTQVQLEIYPLLKFACEDNSKLHLTKVEPTNACVNPGAGGYTVYTCP